MQPLDNLYNLMQQLRECIEEVWKENITHPNVKPLPLPNETFVSVGGAGVFPQYSACAQMTYYIGPPYAGLVAPGDAVVAMAPGSVMITAELFRCRPEPKVTPKGISITEKYRKEVDAAAKEQSADMILLQEAGIRFCAKNDMRPSEMNVEISVGSDEGGSQVLYMTCVVNTTLRAGNISLEPWV